MEEEYYQLSHTGKEIDNAVSEIDNLKNHIETNTANIQTNTTDINTLKRSVSNKDSQITSNTDKIKDCFKRIDTIESTTVNSLQAQINNNSTDISGLRDLLDKKVGTETYDKAVKDLKSKDNQLQLNIDAVAKDQTDQLNLVKDRVLSNAGNIKSLSNRVDTINESIGSIEELTQSVSSLSQTYNEFIAGDFASTKKTANDALATANNALTAVGKLQTTHQTDIEKIQKNISDLSNIYVTKTKFDELSAIINGEDGIADSITNLNNQITELQKQITNLQRQIDELKNSTP